MPTATQLLHDLREMSAQEREDQQTLAEKRFLDLQDATFQRLDTADLSGREKDIWMWSAEHHLRKEQYSRLVRWIRKLFRRPEAPGEQVLIFSGPLRSYGEEFFEQPSDDLLKEPKGKAILQKVEAAFRQMASTELELALQRSGDLAMMALIASKDPGMVSHLCCLHVAKIVEGQLPKPMERKVSGEKELFLMG